MQSKRVWARLLGVEHTVVEAVCFDEQADSIVASVRPARGRRRRCGICGRRSPGFDQGEGRRRWRALDLGTVQALLEADAPRVRCRQHGVVVAAVPWARHGAGFTRSFEDTAAWLAVHTSQAAVAELLRDCRRRGMGAPVVMVGDGALGLWRALEEVFPATCQQRDWVHKTANVLACLPKAVQAGARKALAEIRDAPDRDHARRAIEAFARDYGVKWPKAVAKVTDDQDALLCFFDYPAEHWLHLRTTNPIESSFSPVRARTRVTKGPGTKDTGLAMVFKLLQAAEGRWRAVNGPHLVALVRAGARFEAGKLIERPDQTPDKEADEDVTKVAA